MVKIWMNHDPSVVDVSYLDERFASENFDFLKLKIEDNDIDQHVRLANEYDIVISSSEKWNVNTLKLITNKPEFVVRYGTGIDNISLPDMSSFSIPVANVPGANAAAVAEIALLHILNLGRRFAYTTSKVKAGIWPATITGTEMDGKIVGLVGFGSISRQLVRMLTGFDIDIHVYDPFIKSEVRKEFPQINFVDSLENLLSVADFVSLHLPLNESTRGSIGIEEFKLMKQTAYIINTCRGEIIRESDLITALKEEIIAGAGLDVMEIEPPSQENELLKFENVFITSHTGAASIESELRSQKIIADSIIEFSKGKIPRNVLNKEILS